MTTDTRRRRDPEARPHQILEAAFLEFGTHGLAGARLDDIAKRANVAKGTIYLYFPNKEALFREMVHATTIAALEAAEARLADTDDASATTSCATWPRAGGRSSAPSASRSCSASSWPNCRSSPT